MLDHNPSADSLWAFLTVTLPLLQHVAKDATSIFILHNSLNKVGATGCITVRCNRVYYRKCVLGIDIGKEQPYPRAPKANNRRTIMERRIVHIGCHSGKSFQTAYP